MTLNDYLRSAADKFHTHLDVCEQCEQHPFNLCAIGHELLVAVGKAMCPRCGHVHQGEKECGEEMGANRFCRCELEVAL
jgi:hypothetical protein